MILEIEADHLRVGRQCIDPLFATRTKKLDRRHIAQLGVVEFRDRGWVHDITPFDLDRIGVGGRDMSVAADILVKLDMHQAIFLNKTVDFLVRHFRKF